MENKTLFYDTDGKLLADEDFILPIALYKGMTMTIHGYPGAFEVVDWNYHYGHADEDPGLRIILSNIR